MPIAHVNGVDISYELSGDGPPIVFIHGMNLTKEIWAPQVDALASSYSMLRYDLRGHGDTPTTATEEYSYDLLADDLNALLETLDINSPTVCGHSLGAGVALRYATTYPEKLSQLVLVGIGEPGYRAAVRRKLLELSLSLTHRFFSEDRAETMEPFFVNLLTDGPEYDPEEMPGDGRIPEEEMEKYKPLLDYGLEAFHLNQIRVPTLVLNGEYEPTDGSEVAAQISTAVCDTVSGAGHHPNWTHPDAFTTTLQSFLSGNTIP